MVKHILQWLLQKILEQIRDFLIDNGINCKIYSKLKSHKNTIHSIEINKKDRTTILNSYLNGKLRSLLFLIITNDERVNFNDYGCRGCLMIDFNTDRVKIELEQTLEENHSEDLGHMTFLIEENGIGDDADFLLKAVQRNQMGL